MNCRILHILTFSWEPNRWIIKKVNLITIKCNPNIHLILINLPRVIETTISHESSCRSIWSLKRWKLRNRTRFTESEGSDTETGSKIENDGTHGRALAPSSWSLQHNYFFSYVVWGNLLCFRERKQAGVRLLNTNIVCLIRIPFHYLHCTKNVNILVQDPRWLCPPNGPRPIGHWAP